MRINQIIFVSIFIIIMLAVILALVWQEAPVSNYYVPDGYNKAVNKLINKGKLYFNLETNRIDTTSLSEREREFYFLSYLSDDVRKANEDHELELRFKFNRTDDGKISKLISIDKNVHTFLYGPMSWRGYIFYRKPQSQIAILRSNKNVFAIRRRNKIPLLPNNARPDVTESADALATSSVSSSDLINYTSILNLKLPAKYRSEHVASVYYYGFEDLILDVSAAGIRSYDRIWLNNQTLYTGQRIKLKNNDFIKVGAGNTKEEFLVNVYNPRIQQASSDFGTIAAPSFIHGHLQSKVYDPSISFIPTLISVLDAIVKNSPNETSRLVAETTDVHLSIDIILNRVIQDQLNRFFANPQQYIGVGLRKSKKHTNGSITLMDVQSGEILAIASFNADTTLKRDHNFRLHPLGSAFKVFLAAAALKTNPRLYSFKITGQAERDNVLGYRLTTPFTDHVSGQIDFNKFLEHSSNHYAFALLLMALSSKNSQGIIKTINQPSENYWFNGQVYNRSPDCTHYLSNYKSPNFIETSEIAQNLEYMFDTDMQFNAKDFVIHETSVWDSLKKTAPKLDEFIEYQLRRVSPERSFIPLNVIRDQGDVRFELVPFSLGDWENKWTNIKAAEALCRVITNRKIWASFIERYRKGLDNSSQLLPTRDHNRLLKAMELVSGPHGTAKQVGIELRRLKQKGLKSTVKIFSKTGTANPNEAMLRKGQPAHRGFYMFAMVDTESGVMDGIVACVYFENFRLQGVQYGSTYPMLYSAKLLLEQIAKYKGWLK